jgi:hypothetical protein
VYALKPCILPSSQVFGNGCTPDDAPLVMIMAKDVAKLNFISKCFLQHCFLWVRCFRFDGAAAAVSAVITFQHHQLQQQQHKLQNGTKNHHHPALEACTIQTHIKLIKYCFPFLLCKYCM